jgi:hypothetical protein
MAHSWGVGTINHWREAPFFVPLPMMCPASLMAAALVSTQPEGAKLGERGEIQV